MKFLVVIFTTSVLSGCQIMGTGSPGGSFCFACSESILDIDGEGGSLYLDTNTGTYDKMVALGASNCKLRGFDTAKIAPPHRVGSNGVNHYRYECIRTPASKYSPPTPVTQPNAVNQSISFEEAKRKCTELGFQPASEGFGNCVLKLSK